jgi:DNA-binding CsgD family transcriptional regulator
VQLTAAFEAFQRMGAVPLANRANNELRASGMTKRRTNVVGALALTPQEREIALLAASGLTNKEIAERLFLAPKTVSAHLYRIFPKLGITSRAALRDALGSSQSDEP